MITGIDLNFLGEVDGVANRAILRVFTSAEGIQISHLLSGLRDEDIAVLQAAGEAAMATMNKFCNDLKEREIVVVEA